MGKTTRWLKGLLGLKRDKEKVPKKSNPAEKNGRGFVKSEPLSQIPAGVSDWARPRVAGDRRKRGIAVAGDRGRLMCTGGREGLAAAKIQCVFRGHLARKARRALRGLVRFQAIIRGYLVRKRAAATLHSMEALIRAQILVRSQRARRSMSNGYKSQPEIRIRKPIREFHCKSPSFGAFDESPRKVAINTSKSGSRSGRMSTSNEYSNDRQYYINRRFDEEEYRCAMAQNTTPRLGCSDWGLTTPAKTECGERFYMNYPSYMASTQSFSAKLRPHSTPKQRPGSGPKRRLSLDGPTEPSRASFRGVS